MDIKTLKIAEENTRLKRSQDTVLIFTLIFLAINVALISFPIEFVFLASSIFWIVGVIYLRYLDAFGKYFISKEGVVIDFENKRVKSIGIEIPFSKIVHIQYELKGSGNKNNGENTFNITTIKNKKYEYKILLQTQEDIKSFKDTMERLDKAIQPF